MHFPKNIPGHVHQLHVCGPLLVVDENADDIAIKQPMQDDPPGCGLTDLGILPWARKDLGYEMQVSLISSPTSFASETQVVLWQKIQHPGPSSRSAFFGAVPVAPYGYYRACAVETNGLPSHVRMHRPVRAALHDG